VILSNTFKYNNDDLDEMNSDKNLMVNPQKVAGYKKVILKIRS